MKQREKLWTQSKWLIAEESKTFVYALGPNQTNIFWADVQSAGKERANKQECEANAQLISAAPDLVEALEDCIALWGDFLPPGNSNAMKAFTKARAALDKAYGDSQ